MDRLAAMETFIRVVQSRSFSAAARHLNIGQPAVSKSIAQLEERLGVRLLMRSTRGLMPTEAGQSYYERARRAIEEANEAEFVARGAATHLAGRLRISTGGTFSSLHVVPRLPQFLAAHPHLSIDLVLDDRLIDLIEEGVDIALRVGTLRDSSLTARKISTGRRLVLGTPAYFERAGVPATPAELSRHAAVVYSQESGCDCWRFRRDASEITVNMSSRLRASAAEGIRAAVLGGMGLTIASEWMFAPELASGAVLAVLTEWTLPPSGVWAVFPTGRMASAKSRAFASFMETELRQPHCGWGTASADRRAFAFCREKVPA
jgi:DNA-binding transcriptional LysR family regulator